MSGQKIGPAKGWANIDLTPIPMDYQYHHQNSQSGESPCFKTYSYRSYYGFFQILINARFWNFRPTVKQLMSDYVGFEPLQHDQHASCAESLPGTSQEQWLLTADSTLSSTAVYWLNFIRIDLEFIAAICCCHLGIIPMTSRRLSTSAALPLAVGFLKISGVMAVVKFPSDNYKKSTSCRCWRKFDLIVFIRTKFRNNPCCQELIFSRLDARTCQQLETPMWKCSMPRADQKQKRCGNPGGQIQINT